MKIGVIERVVENWLTSANERQFQIPFCQVLASEGETVVYVSPHGPQEQGKDVITIGLDKIPCGYQLKGGRLNLSDWRKYKGEIEELVEYQIDHPSIRSRKQHRSYLVTNGTVADPVLDRIKAANQAWKRRGFKPLSLIAKGQLVARFVNAHGSFLPRETKDFSSFLELIVKSGREPFDKRKFSSFLESILPIRVSQHAVPRDVGRAITSAVLLTSYIIQGCEREENHWAVFEAWIVVAAYILAAASKHSTPKQWWSSSFELCELGAVRAVQSLYEECASNKTLFTQGDLFTDGAFYPLRITILAGTLSALSLYYRLKSQKWEGEGFVQEFLMAHVNQARVWGESATPYFMMAALELEQHGAHARAETQIAQVLRTILDFNTGKGRGLPNSYYEPEEAIRLMSGMDSINREIFIGHSYTVEPLIEYFARRLSRNLLTHFWEKITRVQVSEFRPKAQWEWFRWKAVHGSLDSRMPQAPQSWADLLNKAENGPTSVPDLLIDRPTFALFFGMVFPHRFGVGLLRLIDRALRKSAE